MEQDYVHGRSAREEARLFDQANSLSELLHWDTRYPPGSRVLEAGCGVGAQTVILAGNSPQASFFSMDIAPESIRKAKTLLEKAGMPAASFALGDLYEAPFPQDAFDHIFVCFVLEHLKEPLEALLRLQTVLKPGGTLTVIEGDHGSAYFHPRSQYADRAIQCLVEVQRRFGGDALIGRRLYPLLSQAGFQDVRVSPRMVYVDDSKPAWVEGFTRNTFNAMVAGVKEQALKLGLMDEASWKRGLADLERTAQPGGTFCYTFFKATACRQAAT